MPGSLTWVLQCSNLRTNLIPGLEQVLIILLNRTWTAPFLHLTGTSSDWSSKIVSLREGNEWRQILVKEKFCCLGCRYKGRQFGWSKSVNRNSYSLFIIHLGVRAVCGPDSKIMGPTLKGPPEGPPLRKVKGLN